MKIPTEGRFKEHVGAPTPQRVLFGICQRVSRQDEHRHGLCPLDGLRAKPVEQVEG